MSAMGSAQLDDHKELIPIDFLFNRDWNYFYHH